MQTLKPIFMQEKKLVYRHIRMLENFASCQRLSVNVPKTHRLFECSKLIKLSSGDIEKYITFMYSTEELPQIDPLVFDVHIHMLKDHEIKSLVAQCKEYGIAL